MARRAAGKRGSLALPGPAPLKNRRSDSVASKPTDSPIPAPRPAHRPPRNDVAATALIKARVTPALHKRVIDEAARLELSASAWLTEAIETALARGSTR